MLLKQILFYIYKYVFKKKSVIKWFFQCQFLEPVA